MLNHEPSYLDIPPHKDLTIQNQKYKTFDAVVVTTPSALSPNFPESPDEQAFDGLQTGNQVRVWKYDMTLPTLISSSAN